MLVLAVFLPFVKCEDSKVPGNCPDNLHYGTENDYDLSCQRIVFPSHPNVPSHPDVKARGSVV